MRFNNITSSILPLNYIPLVRQVYRNSEHVSIHIDGSVESSIVIHLAHIYKTRSHSNDKLQAVYFKGKQINGEEFVREMVDK